MPTAASTKSLESWIWDAACSIRGAKDAPKYKDFILNPKLRDKLRTFDRVVATAQRGSAFSLAKPHRRASRREDNPMWNQDWFTEADYDADELSRFPTGAGFPGEPSFTN